MDSVMKGLMCQYPLNFWARTAPARKTIAMFTRDRHYIRILVPKDSCQTGRHSERLL